MSWNVGDTVNIIPDGTNAYVIARGVVEIDHDADRYLVRDELGQIVAFETLGEGMISNVHGPVGPVGPVRLERVK